ncbi:hypothetical protein B0H14DRAFT_1617282 [Mycena olivaceomarginata]|nr:hypothetical protein B0H14DRAFT_1617282 [Mycena olivaceomarginata]
MIMSDSSNPYSTSNATTLPSSFSEYPQGQFPQLEPFTGDPGPSDYSPDEGFHGLDYSATMDSEPLSGSHGFNGPLSLVARPLPPPQNPDPSQYHLSLPPSLQFPALDYPLDWAAYTTGSNVPVESSAGNQDEAHPPDFEAGPSQLSLYAVDPLINNEPVFPWNSPQNAPATSINGGTFIAANVNNIQRHSEAGLHILYRAIAGDAFHDSAERYPQPRCHPETRTRLLDVLWKWACGSDLSDNWTSHDPSEEPDSWSDMDNEPNSPILWLHGPAGSGKSAIAQSLCQRLKTNGRLGGSFFFKRGHPSRGNAQKLFPTIAYQLALLLPELNQFISQTIENDPAIVDRSLSTQLQELIVEPCRRSSLSQPVPVIIDGLDECDGKHIQEEILRSIGNVICQENLPILFFIASRPESHIRETFTGPSLDGLHRPLNVNQSFHDVRRYLVDEFSRIHREHRIMAAVPSPWPSSEIVETLVEKSSGYFIYVSTVVKFIDDKRFRPLDRLNIILGIKNSSFGSPFDALDKLYHQILSGVPLDFQPQVLEILASIKANFDLSVYEIEQLLELETGDVRLFLRDLHSVIKLPDEDDVNMAVYAHHASFLDFLDNPSRSGSFCVGSSQCRTNLTYHILKAFSSRPDESLQKPWDPVGG